VELVQQDVSGIGEAGYSPLLLEARDRIGGRVYPFSFQPNLIKENDSQYDAKIKDLSVTIQLGANWIHGLNENINPFYQVAKVKLNLEFQQTSSDDEPGDDVLLFDIVTSDNGGINNSHTIAPNDGDEVGGGAVLSSVNSSSSSFSVEPINPTDYKSALVKYEWIKDNFDRFLAQLWATSTPSSSSTSASNTVSLPSSTATLSLDAIECVSGGLLSEKSTSSSNSNSISHPPIKGSCSS
jgi:hypothetical protein